MSTIYYSRLKNFFTTISESARHFKELQRLTNLQLDHLDHLDRTCDKNFARSLSELKIMVSDDGMN